MFENTSTGSQALVIVGTAAEVVAFLAKHASSGIENRITALPAIYMGITPYRPHEQFKVTVPIFEVAKQFVGTLASAGQEIWGATPTPPLDILGKLKDTAELIDFVKELNMEKIGKVDLKEKIKRKLGLGKPQVLYVKFSYLQEPGLQKIGEQKISFKEVLNELLPGIRTTAAEAKAAG